MMKRLLSLLLALGLPTAPAWAQLPPGKPIVITVPFSAGSAPDALTRALAQDMARQSGQTVIVDNKPGANSVLAAQAVAHAKPDGLSVLVAGNVAFTANPHIYKHLAYDPVKDFEPVTALAKGAMLLYVNPRTVHATTLGQLLAAAKKEPGKYTFAYTSPTSRLPAELLQQRAGIQLTGVPYKSGYQAVPDVMGGQVDMLFTDLGAWPQVQQGKLRALATTDDHRSPAAPQVPTLKEAGVADVVVTYWLAAYVPHGTPAATVAQLRQYFVNASTSAAVKQAHAVGGTYTFLNTPQELAVFQASEAAAWGKALKAAGIEPE